MNIFSTRMWLWHIHFFAGIGNFNQSKCGIFSCTMCLFHLVASVWRATSSPGLVSVERAWRVGGTLSATGSFRTVTAGSWYVRCELSNAWVQIYLNGASFGWIFWDGKSELQFLCHILNVVSAYLHSERASPLLQRHGVFPPKKKKAGLGWFSECLEIV